MDDSTGAGGLERIEQGLNAVFTAEATADILDAVDFEAILADEPAQAPVDAEQLAEALGRPVGRLLAHRVLGGSGATGLAKRAIGSEVGSRVTSGAVRVAVENVDTDAVTETLVEIDEETPGPALRDAVVPHLEASDLLAFEGGEATTQGVDVGGDAVGVDDAAGADHTGALDASDSGTADPFDE
jgi:hypothetical protein